jgi:glucose/arabinose dehydrogenase
LDRFGKRSLTCGALFAILVLLLGLTPGAGAQTDEAGAESLVAVDVAAEPAQAALDIVLPPGYTITEFASGFTSAIAMYFARNGDLYVLNSGFPGFEPGLQLKPIEIWKVSPNGQKTRVYSSGTVGQPALPGPGVEGGSGNAPGSPSALRGVALGIAVIDDDTIFVNDGEGLKRVRRDGSVTVLLDTPTLGDHNADHIVIGEDGKLYWGQGSATNSGVVGPDNQTLTGWLRAHPNYRDIPCRDVMLSGKNYVSENILTDDPNDTVETGPFLPFGTRATPGQVIPGQVPCTSAILRANQDGSGVEMVAWGFRNPFGLAFSTADGPLRGALVVTNNGADVRGSRPIESDSDDLYVITPGGWYGWPDYLDGLPVTQPRFQPGAGERGGVAPLLWVPTRAEALGAAAHFEKGISADGLDFSRSDAFGYKHNAFVAMWGSLGFGQQPLFELVGYNVYRVNFQWGPNGTWAGTTTEIFARNRIQGPASQVGLNGFEHPVDVKFSPDGSTMYILDFGVPGRDGSGRIFAVRKSS